MLSDVLGSDDLRADMLAKARANSERFTGQQLADHMIHIYRSVLTHRRLFQE